MGHRESRRMISHSKVLMRITVMYVLLCEEPHALQVQPVISHQLLTFKLFHFLTEHRVVLFFFFLSIYQILQKVSKGQRFKKQMLLPKEDHWKCIDDLPSCHCAAIWTMVVNYIYICYSRGNCKPQLWGYLTGIPDRKYIYIYIYIGNDIMGL